VRWGEIPAVFDSDTGDIFLLNISNRTWVTLPPIPVRHRDEFGGVQVPPKKFKPDEVEPPLSADKFVPPPLSSKQTNNPAHGP
jgi:hypothetical protein